MREINLEDKVEVQEIGKDSKQAHGRRCEASRGRNAANAQRHPRHSSSSSRERYNRVKRREGSRRQCDQEAEHEARRKERRAVLNYRALGRQRGGVESGTTNNERACNREDRGKRYKGR
jgi:hypothetical protein